MQQGVQRHIIKPLAVGMKLMAKGSLLSLSGLSWSLKIYTKALLSSCEGAFVHFCVISNFG